MKRPRSKGTKRKATTSGLANKPGTLSPESVALVLQLQNIIAMTGLLSKRKARLWMGTPNPHFGNLTPIEMIERGLSHKVKRFVEAALSGERKD